MGVAPRQRCRVVQCAVDETTALLNTGNILSTQAGLVRNVRIRWAGWRASCSRIGIWILFMHHEVLMFYCVLGSVCTCAWLLVTSYLQSFLVVWLVICRCWWDSRMFISAFVRSFTCLLVCFLFVCYLVRFESVQLYFFS